MGHNSGKRLENEKNHYGIEEKYVTINSRFKNINGGYQNGREKESKRQTRK